MAHNDPQQELFTAIKMSLEAEGFKVYDGFLPPENTPYPFVYLGDSQQIDATNKSAVFGNVYQTIHYWHSDPKKRGSVSSALLTIKTTLRKITHTANFAWAIRSINQRIMPDTTTKQPLLHGIIETDWHFS